MRRAFISTLILLTVILYGCSKGSFAGDTTTRSPATNQGASTGNDNGAIAEGTGNVGAQPSTDNNMSDPNSSASQTPTSAQTSTNAGFTAVGIETIPIAPAPMYGVTLDALYAIDPTSGQATMIARFNQAGSVGGSNIYDIAIDGKGKMFAVDQKSLYAVNPLTAALIKIMDLNLNMVNALTILSDGSMVVGGSGVIIVDGVSHTIRSLVADGTYTSSGDLIALPNQELYWTTTSSFLGMGNDRLMKIDPASGAITAVGTTDQGQIWGLGYAGGKMYSFTNNGGIKIISATTGITETTLVNANPATPWTGATTNPVQW